MKSKQLLKIIFMLIPSLLCKMIFSFCLIVSMIKICFCEYDRRLAQRFLCYFLFRLPCS